MPFDLDAAGERMARDALEFKKCGSCSGGAPPPGVWNVVPAGWMAGRHLPRPTTQASSSGAPLSLRVPGAPAEPSLPGFPVDWTLAEPTAATVDIYLSAGRIEEYLGADVTKYRSCSNDNMGACSLWRVQVTLGDVASVVGVELIAAAAVTATCTGGEGMVQAAVSPSGLGLAFAAVCHATYPETHGRTLIKGDRVLSPAAGDPSFVQTDTLAVDAQFPNWYDDSTVIFDESAGTEASDLPSLYQEPETAILGPASATQTGRGFQDPHTSRADGRIVTFGGASTTNLLPQVDTIDGSSPESFETGDAAFTDCHHPAWNPDGDAILCTRIAKTEDIDTSAGTDQEQLYQFRFNGKEWGSPVRLLSEDAWKELDIAVFPRQGMGSPECLRYVYKFAEWCGSEDWIVATVFCADQNLATAAPYNEVTSGIFCSRVMLIDTRNWVAPVFYDLVSALEDAAGDARGEWAGIFGTCAQPAVA